MSHEPGPELDRLVAEAIGWDSSFHDWQQIGCGHIDSAHECSRCRDTYFGDALKYEASKECVPMFSLDWFAAMEAAERCGLFRTGRNLEPPVLGMDGCGNWAVYAVNSAFELSDEVSCAPTGPHAISLAILEISRSTP